MALLEIIDHKNKIIKERATEILALKSQLSPSKKSLLSAFNKENKAFVCEIKPSSPSQGIIKKNVDVLEVAKIYAPFADAISVLADEKFFGGSLKNVKEISSKQICPILCKDVIVSELQIYEARYYGADAVLLMLSVLTDDKYRVCERAAKELNMEVICEVHTEEEMERAKKHGAKIIGINNRNLKTLEIDLSTVERLSIDAPKNAILISESGINTHAQVKKIAPLVDGFLIGTSLMKADRIDLALREIIFGRVKICGLTSPEDAKMAYECGAYYGGLNFSSKSSRFVTVDLAKRIVTGAPLIFGGIFVNQSIEEVNQIANEADLDFVQLHGDETQIYVNDLRQLLKKDCEIWKAVQVKDNFVIPDLLVDRILLDSFDKNHYGGTGKNFDWAILSNQDIKELVIAGGINALNIETISSLNPFALDIASGVEEMVGTKSFIKMKEIFNKLRP